MGFVVPSIITQEGLILSNQDVKKNVPIYFYYLTISKEKDAKDNTTYGIDQIVDFFLQCYNEF